jgi:hypothetical protein
MNARTARQLRELAFLNAALATAPGQPIQPLLFKRTMRDLKRQWNKTPWRKRAETRRNVENATVQYREALRSRLTQLQEAQA